MVIAQNSPANGVFSYEDLLMELPSIPARLWKWGLKPISSNRIKPEHMILCGFDTETIKGDLDLFGVGNVTPSGKINIVQEKISHQGIHMLDRFPKKAYITAHNLEFDLGAILGDNICMDLMHNIPIRDNDYNIWHGFFANTYGSSWCMLSKKNGRGKTIRRLIFVDSSNFFKGRLKDIAAAYFPEFPKEKSPDWLGEREPKTLKERNDYRFYHRRDCLIQTMLTRLIYSLHEIDTVPLSITQAQLSMRTFKKKYLNQHIYQCPIDQQREIINAYAGARAEAFGRGYYKKVKLYDINSLYPYATCEQPLPFSVAGTRGKTYQSLSLDDLENGAEGWFNVSYNHDILHPLLPVRRGRLSFPVKSTRQWVCSPELRLALERNQDVILHKGYGWWPTEGDINHPLKSFMIDVYARRKEAKKNKDKLMDDLNKILMNSLIGKFVNQIHNCEVVDHEDRREYIKTIKAGMAWKPEFWMLILAKSRSILDQYIKKDTFYVNTDSVMVRHSIPVNKELGGMKLEAEGNALVIRPRLFFVFNDKDSSIMINGRKVETPWGSISKYATHGFNTPGFIKDKKGKKIEMTHDWFAQRLFNNIMNLPYGTENIKHKRQRMIKIRESIIRKLKSRTMEPKSNTVTFVGDKVRSYNEDLTMIGQLRESNIYSKPIAYGI